MKSQNRFLVLIVLMISCSILSIQSTASDIVYDNGPVNGTVDGWTINYGFSVLDSFYLASRTQVTGFDFWVEELSSDTMLSVHWQISGGSHVGGLSPGGIADISNSFNQGLLVDTPLPCNAFCPISVDEISITQLPGVDLAAGTYWLTLSDAVMEDGNPVYWDENSGAGCGGWMGTGQGCPSSARDSAVGTIPSEAFDIRGNTLNDSSGSPGATPEPSSILLLGSGLVGVGGMMRWRFTK